jgi:hypothetical protein
MHRRCAEPMFSLANGVADGGLMVNATPARPSLIRDVLGTPHWIDVQPGRTDDTWSGAEGRIVLDLIQRLGATGAPDDIYAPFASSHSASAKGCAPAGACDHGLRRLGSGRERGSGPPTPFKAARQILSLSCLVPRWQGRAAHGRGRADRRNSGTVRRHERKRTCTSSASGQHGHRRGTFERSLMPCRCGRALQHSSKLDREGGGFMSWGAGILMAERAGKAARSGFGDAVLGGGTVEWVYSISGPWLDEVHQVVGHYLAATAAADDEAGAFVRVIL